MITFFFFNDPATTEIYTLSLHDALPIFMGLHHPPDALVVGRWSSLRLGPAAQDGVDAAVAVGRHLRDHRDRKSTRLNSSHANISYAVFCLKKKKNRYINQTKPYIR